MEPVEYVFRIDAFTPDTLPMARLAEYLAALARMVGHAEHTHFVRVDPGSAKLVHRVDPVDAPKVETRLNDVRLGTAPKEALAAQRTIENLLANDNAVGSLVETASGRVVVPFVGRNRPKALTFPPFKQETAIYGQIVSIGGRDSTAHAMVQDGETLHTGLTMTRDLARELAKLLYGPLIRLHGTGKFERQADGVWKMLDFRVDRFEEVSSRPVSEALNALRDIPGNRLLDDEVLQHLADVRDGEDGSS